LKSTISIIAIVIVFASCQKQPTANFNTDKSIYYASETVHITDASTNAHHWQWTMPNGTSNINSKKADYTIPADDLGGNETFNLKVTSRYNSLNSSISKSVRVSQQIYGSDYYSSTYNPTTKSTAMNNGEWVVSVGKKYNGIDNYSNLRIEFYNSKPTSNGVYILQDDLSPLTLGHARLVIEASGGVEVNIVHFISLSGYINIASSQNGELRATFNNIPTKNDADTAIIKISGDITCH
jgi:PKD repeat protein